MKFNLDTNSPAMRVQDEHYSLCALEAHTHSGYRTIHGLTRH